MDSLSSDICCTVSSLQPWHSALYFSLTSLLLSHLWNGLDLWTSVSALVNTWKGVRVLLKTRCHNFYELLLNFPELFFLNFPELGLKGLA